MSEEFLFMHVTPLHSATQPKTWRPPIHDTSLTTVDQTSLFDRLEKHCRSSPPRLRLFNPMPCNTAPFASHHPNSISNFPQILYGGPLATQPNLIPTIIHSYLPASSGNCTHHTRTKSTRSEFHKSTARRRQRVHNCFECLTTSERKDISRTQTMWRVDMTASRSQDYSVFLVGRSETTICPSSHDGCKNSTTQLKQTAAFSARYLLALFLSGERETRWRRIPKRRSSTVSERFAYIYSPFQRRGSY